MNCILDWVKNARYFIAADVQNYMQMNLATWTPIKCSDDMMQILYQIECMEGGQMSGPVI